MRISSSVGIGWARARASFGGSTVRRGAFRCSQRLDRESWAGVGRECFEVARVTGDHDRSVLGRRDDDVGIDDVVGSSGRE